VCRTLQNAIESGRVAHAFLFTGARGVGKTSAARILAKALQCESGPLAEPCNICPACCEITAGTSVDVFEIDGASNTGVDDIRELRENIKYLPSRCRFKIFIIDEVHMLSTNAFNALLKTLEEPPPHVKFIFATTEPHKVPVTILSRCQRFDFKRIPLPKIVERLRRIMGEEKVSISDAALTAIARKGDGSMRDSLSTLDQVLAFCGEKVDDEEVNSLLGVVDRRLLLETSRSVFARNCRDSLEIVARIDSFGCNFRYFCQELIEHFRNLAVLKVTSDPTQILDLTEGELGDLRQCADMASFEDIQRHLSILLKAESEMAQSGFTRLILEMALLKMAMLLPLVPIHELLARLKSLEEIARQTPTGAASPSPGARDTRPSAAKLPQQPDRNESGVAVSGMKPEERGWPGFVSFVATRKIRLGSLLEHGRPLRFSAECIEIGFPPGSFHMSCLQDSETLAALTELAQQYWNASPAIRLTPFSGGKEELPPTLQEEKTRKEADRKGVLMENARKNQVVTAALEIFGGDIEKVVDLEQDSDMEEDKD